MELIDFRNQVEELHPEDSEKIRTQYIAKFVNIDHPRYEQQIACKHIFRDGSCYLGYLWDYMREPIVVNEKETERYIEPCKEIMVFWDIHSNERILIKDYWKFGKENVLKMKFITFLQGEQYLPEDVYIFDDSFSWTFVKTHEEIEGIRYCLKCRST